MDEKKSERLEVRLGFQEKSKFVDACETQGDTPSSALRRFIRGYVRRANADLIASAWRSIPWLRWPYIMGGFAAFIGIGMAVWAWGLPKVTADSEDVIFAARDINSDGQLELAEIGIPPRLGGEPNGVMRVLDLDGSGTLSREEFIREGRMVYALSETQTENEKAVMTLVEFEFDKHRTQSGTYENAVVNAGKLDRLILWQVDGTTSVFEGDVAIKSGSALTIEADDAQMSE